MLRSNRALLTGVGLGLGLMYFMDPQRGRRRRALVRDKITHSTRVSTDALGAVYRDFSHRTVGLMSRARGILRRGPVDDEVLVERVRARLGRLVSHPHAIEVKANDGYLHLRGPILESDVARLIRGVNRVRGVRQVTHALDVHQAAGNTPALQGAGSRHRG